MWGGGTYYYSEEFSLEGGTSSESGYCLRLVRWFNLHGHGKRDAFCQVCEEARSRRWLR